MASRLAIPPVDGIITGFVDCLDTAAVGAATTATTISSTNVPLEVSFTGRPGDDRTLRLLAEPLEPGGGPVGRCYLGVNALVRLLEHFSAHRDPGLVGQVVAGVFPSGGERTALRWNAAVWLALRTDGANTGLRAYVNLHNRPAGDRYLRAIKVLDHLGLAADASGVQRLAGLLGTWATPIGLSLDFAAGTVRTARLHFNTRFLAYRKLSMLLSGVASARLRDMVAFLETFEITPGGSAEPLLLSVGLDSSGIDSVKCDVSISAVPPASAAARLDDLERRFGPIAGRHLAGDLFSDPSLLRYIGLTASRRHEPYLNVYYSAPALPVGMSREAKSVSRASLPRLIERGLRFVRAQRDEDGAIRAEARSTTDPGAVAAHSVADRLVTSLVEAEHRRLSSQPPDISERRTLARPQGEHVVQPLYDGGFAWSANGQRSGPADPTATLCVLAGVFPIPDVGWDPERTRAYLQHWLFAPTSPRCPACPDGCRSLLPLYLAAASPALALWHGQSGLQRLREEVLGQRRDDGTWGLAGPEAMETALAVLTLNIIDRSLSRTGLNAGDRRELVKFFAGAQYADGGWCWAPLLCDGRGTWFGHRAVTTVLVIRALIRLGLSADTESYEAYGPGIIHSPSFR